MGAVTLVILSGARALGDVAARTHAAGRFHDLAGEVLVLEVDAGVDDPDAHAGAGRAGPRRLGADAGQAPLVLERRIVADAWAAMAGTSVSAAERPTPAAKYGWCA